MDQDKNKMIGQLEDDYYLGGYQSCINTASTMTKCAESTFYMCLSYYHLGKFDMIKLETSKSEDLCVKLIDKLVAYTEEKDQRAEIVEELLAMMDKGQVEAQDELSRILISSIFVREKLYTDALSALGHLNSLRCRFARTSIYQQMNRLDLAEKEVSQMTSANKYSTLALLATVPTDDGYGCLEPHLSKAQELENLYKPTPLIVNLQSAAAIATGNYDLAKEHCQRALDMDNDSAEALINMLHYLSKTKATPQVKERFLNRLKTVHPDHEYIRELQRIDTELV